MTSTRPSDFRPRFDPLGEHALQLDFSHAPAADRFDIRNAWIATLQRNMPESVLELVPGMTALTIFFDPLTIAYDDLKDRLCELKISEAAESHRTRRIEIPICFDEEFALDLNASMTMLDLTPARFIQAYCEPLYRVQIIGFAPGFPYLSGLPAELALPRLAAPRSSVPAGSVGIAGDQTGIYPRKSPGGWRIIGRTPLTLFSLENTPPTRLEPGDAVRFRPIDAAEFQRLAEAAT